ncbi:uncharacterized protein LOC114739711 [Neltuma alba]|uniref:uncharacterized protein LOC114739616 n=1 Tax=Neltuma alba TaxID=207710 RepID=UPI0010A33E76|nr:uncharacterized protein LOC114739616 [Prosopis alba]XP_028783619.1 uncharacterized protein LOC114739711 [Prosopis alba]
MASMQDPSSPLRLLVDRERNRVVVAEASGDFVNALLSFLTLPLGTIIRLLSNKQKQQPIEVGCINNLYQSVQNFDTQVFWNGTCKKMLLWPRNPCEKLCQKLKFNVDDTEPTKYMMCGSCGGGNRTLLSTFAGVSCSCGKLMDKEMKLEGEENNSKGEDGVFVRGDTMYLIFDDLRVLENFPGNTVHYLVQRGHTDLTKLTEVAPNVGLNQIMDLMKRALISKSPLSDVFLTWEDGGSDPVSSFRPILAPSQFGRASNPTMSFFGVHGNDSSLMLKVTSSKSRNKILYAEAEGDFADFLFSFLAMPLGAILKILGGNDFKLGSMHNLYNSVKGLSTWYTSWSNNYSSPYTPLLDLKVAPQYGCIRQPLMLQEEKTPTYWYGTGVIRNMMCYANKNGVISKERHQIADASEISMVDPRCADERTGLTVGFVKRPALFAVTDDLQVTPLTCASSISFLQKLNTPLNDLEQHEVKIGPNEALNLLGASLTSKAALTNGLFHLLKKPKEEATA